MLGSGAMLQRLWGGWGLAMQAACCLHSDLTGQGGWC